MPVEAPLEALSVGEHLEFAVSWFGIPVGTASLQVKETVEKAGRRAYHVVALTKDNAFLSRIYPVSDEVHSYIDAERFCSLEFSKRVEEGRYRAHERIVYDYPHRKAYCESIKNNTHKTADLPAGDVHDLISAFYWFRLQKIEPGKELHLKLNDGDRNWDLDIAVVRKEKKELRGMGAINTVMVEPKTRLKGILVERGRSWVWFTTDRRRLPVLVRIQTPYGSVTGALKEPKL